MQSSLRTQIEAVDTRVGLVIENVIHLTARDTHDPTVHARLDSHELRIRALEDTEPSS